MLSAAVRLKPDTTYGRPTPVRLKPDTTYGRPAPVRLKPDPTYRLLFGLAAVLLLGLFPTPAGAQNTLGGHLGFVLPLVTRADGETTTINEDFLIGFPMGVTIRRSADIAFDLELVPVIQNSPLHVDLTVHPGVIFTIAERIGAGVRMAFDVNKPSWGFTPLVNQSLPLGNGIDLFGELVLPIRFRADSNSIGIGIHFGIGF